MAFFAARRRPALTRAGRWVSNDSMETSTALARFAKPAGRVGSLLLDALLPARCLACPEAVGAPGALCPTCLGGARLHRAASLRLLRNALRIRGPIRPGYSLRRLYRPSAGLCAGGAALRRRHPFPDPALQAWRPGPCCPGLWLLAGARRERIARGCRSDRPRAAPLDPALRTALQPIGPAGSGAGPGERVPGPD